MFDRCFWMKSLISWLGIPAFCSKPLVTISRRTTGPTVNSRNWSLSQ